MDELSQQTPFPGSRGQGPQHQPAKPARPRRSRPNPARHNPKPPTLDEQSALSFGAQTRLSQGDDDATLLFEGSLLQDHETVAGPPSPTRARPRGADVSKLAQQAVAQQFKAMAAMAEQRR